MKLDATAATAATTTFDAYYYDRRYRHYCH